jgi:hypothetical protein
VISLRTSVLSFILSRIGRARDVRVCTK